LNTSKRIELFRQFFCSGLDCLDWVDLTS